MVFFAELLGFVFKAFVELVDVDVDHLVAGLGRFHDDIEGFVAAAVVAFVALRSAPMMSTSSAPMS